MKLATFVAAGVGVDGEPAIGLVDAERRTVLDLRAAHRALLGADAPALGDMLALIDGGEPALGLVRQVGERAAGDARFVQPLATVRLLAPVPEPRQIRDFNNFEQHIRDAPIGMAMLRAKLAGKPAPDLSQFPREIPAVYRELPIYYHSNRFNVIGPDADAIRPRYCHYLDYELEVGMFIGRRGKNIALADAASHIFGYTVFNDFSARDQQGKEMEGRLGPAKGKSFDGGTAVGPWIVTRDELPSAANLQVCVRVNGEVRGRNDTAGMLHSFEEIIAFVSQDETLYPGELFGSGTVGGCCGMEGSCYLADGDVVELEVEGIGVLRNRVAASR